MNEWRNLALQFSECRNSTQDTTYKLLNGLKLENFHRIYITEIFKWRMRNGGKPGSAPDILFWQLSSQTWYGLDALGQPEEGLRFPSFIFLPSSPSVTLLR